MKEIRKSVFVNLLIILGIQLFCQYPAFAQRDRNAVLGGSGGHDVPTPFEIQTRFELADGEVYSLVGNIVLAPPPADESQLTVITKRQLRPYFSINYDNHPWLENAKRVDSPLYFLETRNPEKWEKWGDESIILICRAYGRIVFSSIGPEYEIHLEPINAERFTVSCAEEARIKPWMGLFPGAHY